MLGLFLAAFGLAPAFCAPQPTDYAVFFAGFMAGTTLWCFLIAALIAWGRRFITPVFFRAVNALCAVALACFGVRLAIGVVGLLSV